MASGWMTVWRLDTGTKAIRKDADKMVGNLRLQGDIARRREECKSRKKGNTRG